MKVKRIVVELSDDGRFFDTDGIHVSIYTDQKKFGYTQMVIPDDMTSRFDVIWEHIGRRLKEAAANDSDSATT